MAERPVRPAERLRMMCATLKEVDVADVRRRDWLSVLTVLQVLVRELEQEANGGHAPTRAALVAALHRSQRSGLPVGPNTITE